MSFAADAVILNGRIATLDDAGRTVEALAILDGRILALGGNDDVAGLVGSGTEVIDLEGRTAIPGIIDSHCHPDIHAIMMMKHHDLGPDKVASLEDCLAYVERETARLGSDEWFIGYRYNDVKCVGVPTRTALDAVSNGRPVFILRTDHHIGYANSRACQLKGITDDTPDPPYGAIDRDPETGALTGLMREAAAHLFTDTSGDEHSLDDYVAALPPLFDTYLAHGITSVHNSLTRRKTFEAYQILRGRGRLHMRIGVLANGFDAHLIDDLIAAGIRSGFGDEWIRVIGVEWCPDCSCSGRTAAFYTPYVGTPIPGEPVPNTGMLLYDPDDLKEKAIRAHRAGLRVCMDGIGDRGIDTVLDAFEAALADTPATDHRMRVEHCCNVTPAIADRLERLGVVDSSATGFMHELGDAYINNRGAEAMRHMWPHRTLNDRGIAAPGHSDAPICSPNPWPAIWSMVTRQTDSGRSLDEAEAVSVAEAVRAYTVLGAYAGGEEHLKGTLEAGKLADVAVLDRNVFDGPVDAVRETRVEMTIVGGVVRHRRVTT